MLFECQSEVVNRKKKKKKKGSISFLLLCIYNTFLCVLVCVSVCGGSRLAVYKERKAKRKKKYAAAPDADAAHDGSLLSNKRHY